MSQNSEVMVIRNTGNLPQVIEENSLFSYFEKIKKFPVLSENEETRLIRDFKENGDLTVYAVSGGVSQKFLMTRI